MKMHRLRAVAATLLVAIAVPAVAHHSFVAQYDPAKPKTIAGKVTKVEWTNPHARFYMDVKDEKGHCPQLACRTWQPEYVAALCMEARHAESRR